MRSGMPPESGRSSASWARRRRGLWRGSRRPAISEILSVIILTVALSVGTAVLVFSYLDQQEVREEAVQSHTDLSSMRASELVTWSSAHCSSDGALNFMLHNYGAENLSTTDLRAYGSWSGETREFIPGAISYSTLSNANITGADILGGETAWARIGMGCGALELGGRNWDCINPRFTQPTSFSCAETDVTLITPAEDVVRVDHDAMRDPPEYPVRANVVSCVPPTGGGNTVRICLDTTAQPLPLTGVEAWGMSYGRYVNNNGVLHGNVTAGGITYSSDGNSACFDVDKSMMYIVTRFILVNSEGKSTFGQRPYTIFENFSEETDRVCQPRTLNAPAYTYCSDGRAIPNGEYVRGMCS